MPKYRELPVQEFEVPPLYRIEEGAVGSVAPDRWFGEDFKRQIEKARKAGWPESSIDATPILRVVMPKYNPDHGFRSRRSNGEERLRPASLLGTIAIAIGEKSLRRAMIDMVCVGRDTIKRGSSCGRGDAPLVRRFPYPSSTRGDNMFPGSLAYVTNITEYMGDGPLVVPHIVIPPKATEQ